MIAVTHLLSLPYADDTSGCPEIDREQVPRGEVRQDQEPASGGELAGSKSAHAFHVCLFSFVAPGVGLGRGVALAASLRVLRLMGVVKGAHRKVKTTPTS